LERLLPAKHAALHRYGGAAVIRDLNGHTPSVPPPHTKFDK
jgi:hypothetical protein